MLRNSPRRLAALAVATAGALALSACSAGSLGSSDDEGGAVTLSFLVDNGEGSTTMGEALATAFTEANPDIKVDVETRPQGSEGDNVVKTRLSTGDMTDVFMYNTGSLFQAINPQQNLTPVTEEAWVGKLDEVFKSTVTAGDAVYGAPFGTFMGGAMLYNRNVYDELGLQVPKTWAEFMANNEKIKAAGKAPVIQTYQDTWTSQLFVLGDFHNVAAAEPDFAENYTDNKAKYATSPAAIKGFQRLEQVNKAGYLNKTFASDKLEDGLRQLAKAEGVHYPILTGVIGGLAATDPQALRYVGSFGIPGDDAAKHGLTVWTPGGVYIPKTTEGDKLEAAKKFLAFVASPEGCAAQAEAFAVSGPFAVEGCELPDDVPQAVKDMQPYFDAEGATTPALEFLSPIKGPALEQITVEVGSGIRSAADGARLYDQDVQKQAQQLNLPGW